MKKKTGNKRQTYTRINMSNFAIFCRLAPLSKYVCSGVEWRNMSALRELKHLMTGVKK